MSVRTLGLLAASVLLSCAPEGGEISVSVCDGTLGVRLAAQFGSTGQTIPGSAVLSENGYDFLVVDGTCQFWTQEKSFGEVRTGILGSESVEMLQSWLELARWPQLAGEYVESLCDGPWIFYRFGETGIVVESQCHAESTAGKVKWIRPKVRDAILAIHAKGEPSSGPLRYVLVKETEYPLDSDAYRNPEEWPLAPPAKDVAISVDEASARGQGYSLLAQAGKDADALREVASKFRRGEIGVSYFGFAPVRDASGNRYRLFVRDTLPIEDSRGIWRAR